VAIETGSDDVHVLAPTARIALGTIKREFGLDLTLIGNLGRRVLFRAGAQTVRREADGRVG
jgi:hypothetical protein